MATPTPRRPRRHRVSPWDRNPLLRPADRLEAACRLLAALMVLASLPVAVMIGVSDAAAAGARNESENATKTAVTATIVSEPAAIAVPVGPGVVSRPREATVTWTAHGRNHRTQVTVPATAHRGDTVTQWVDSSGGVTAAPHHAFDAVAEGFDLGFSIVAATGCGATVLVWAVHRVVTRRHSAEWDREWQHLSPGPGSPPSEHSRR
ncbi:Rv1733c family protein [Nocardia tengchongensis]